MLKYLKQIWRSKDLRMKILFTIAILVLYRFTTQISVPGANIEAVRQIFEANAFLGVFSAEESLIHTVAENERLLSSSFRLPEDLSVA